MLAWGADVPMQRVSHAGLKQSDDRAWLLALRPRALDNPQSEGWLIVLQADGER